MFTSLKYYKFKTCYIRASEDWSEGKCVGRVFIVEYKCKESKSLFFTAESLQIISTIEKSRVTHTIASNEELG